MSMKGNKTKMIIIVIVLILKTIVINIQKKKMIIRTIFFKIISLNKIVIKIILIHNIEHIKIGIILKVKNNQQISILY